MSAGAPGSGAGEDGDAGYRNIDWHADLASDQLTYGPSLDGRLPFFEVKAFYVLSDLSESRCGNLWLVPGSHRRQLKELSDAGNQVAAHEAVELRLPPGAAVLWRTAVWHCVGPNLSKETRKNRAYRLPLSLAPPHRLRTASY